MGCLSSRQPVHGPWHRRLWAPPPLGGACCYFPSQRSCEGEKRALPCDRFYENYLPCSNQRRGMEPRCLPLGPWPGGSTVFGEGAPLAPVRLRGTALPGTQDSRHITPRKLRPFGIVP